MGGATREERAAGRHRRGTVSLTPGGVVGFFALMTAFATVILIHAVASDAENESDLVWARRFVAGSVVLLAAAGVGWVAGRHRQAGRG